MVAARTIQINGVDWALDGNENEAGLFVAVHPAVVGQRGYRACALRRNRRIKPTSASEAWDFTLLKWRMALEYAEKLQPFIDGYSGDTCGLCNYHWGNEYNQPGDVCGDCPIARDGDFNCVGTPHEEVIAASAIYERWFLMLVTRNNSATIMGLMAEALENLTKAVRDELAYLERTRQWDETGA